MATEKQWYYYLHLCEQSYVDAIEREHFDELSSEEIIEMINELQELVV